MKKVTAAIAALILVFSLAACGGSKVELDLDAIAGEIAGANLFVDTELQPMDAENIGVFVGVDTSECVSSRFYTGAGATAEEYGLFECADAESAQALVTQLEAHRDDLMTTYQNYAPDAVPRIENAVILSKGQYVIFITAEQYEQAKTLAQTYFS